MLNGRNLSDVGQAFPRINCRFLKPVHNQVQSARKRCVRFGRSFFNHNFPQKQKKAGGPRAAPLPIKRTILTATLKLTLWTSPLRTLSLS